MMRAWMPIRARPPESSKLLKLLEEKTRKVESVQDNAAPAPESGLEVRQSPLKPNIGQRASLLLCAIVPVRDGQLLGKPTPSTIAISNCVHPLRQRFWHFVFSREQLTGCGHCLPLSSNRPPLSGPKVQKRPRGYFCFPPPCPSLISSFQPTEDQRPAKKKSLPCSPYLRTSVRTVQDHTTTRRRKFLCDLSLLPPQHNHTIPFYHRHHARQAARDRNLSTPFSSLRHRVSPLQLSCHPFLVITRPHPPHAAMPPKKGITTATVTRKTAAKKTATATATTAAATKAAATKKTTTTKAAATKAAAAADAADKTAAVTKTTTTKTKTTVTKATATPKKAAAPAKAAPAKKTAAKKTKALEESDKENAGARTKAAAAAKRKREAEEEAEASESEEEQESSAEDEGAAEEEERAPKRAKTSTTKAQPKKAPAKKAAEPKVAAVKKPAAVKKVAAVKQLKEINEAPTQVMDIFVFGEGSSGELGLGNMRYDGKKPIDVKRPRINHNLKDIVQVACGGMHAAALTSSNTILTWGVNDQGALGRDTAWEGGLRDADDEDSDSDSEDSGLNPRESTPAEVNMSGVPEGTKWAKIVASDSATFALATSGLVYGWGTFRVRLLFHGHP